jgi:hypothetical protein
VQARKFGFEAAGERAVGEASGAKHAGDEAAGSVIDGDFADEDAFASWPHTMSLPREWCGKTCTSAAKAEHAVAALLPEGLLHPFSHNIKDKPS